MRVNTPANAGTQLRVLSANDAERIYLGALQVLADVGVLVREPAARDLLAAHGARVEGDLVQVPEWLVKQALGAAPQRFTVHSRDPEKSLHIEPNRVHYGPGPTCPSFLDPYTGQRRPYVMDDAIAVARTCDALEHISFVESLGAISDAPRQQMDVYEFALMAQHTVKPIVAWAFTRETCADIHRMAVAMAGGEEPFRRQPNYIFYAEPMSPLHSGRDAMRKLMYCAEHRIPLVYTPCPIAGGTAPATFAGILVQAAAESLHGLVVSQLISPGTPFIMGGVVSIMDMRDTTLAYGAPELSLLSAGLTEVAKLIGLPMWSTAGCTDAKIVDEQAAVEAAVSIAMAGLSGADLVHDVGFIDSALTGSLEMLVMCDEIIGMVARIARGLEVTPETLAVEVTNAVGPGGKYLGEEHTFRRFRQDCFFPKLAHRANWAKWQEEGATTMGQRINARARRILEEHRPPPLPPEVVGEFERICAAAVARAEGSVQ